MLPTTTTVGPGGKNMSRPSTRPWARPSLHKRMRLRRGTSSRPGSPAALPEGGPGRPRGRVPDGPDRAAPRRTGGSSTASSASTPPGDPRTSTTTRRSSTPREAQERPGPARRTPAGCPRGRRPTPPEMIVATMRQGDPRGEEAGQGPDARPTPRDDARAPGVPRPPGGPRAEGERISDMETKISQFQMLSNPEDASGGSPTRSPSRRCPIRPTTVGEHRAGDRPQLRPGGRRWSACWNTSTTRSKCPNTSRPA